jgi:hypothetical protein
MSRVQEQAVLRYMDSPIERQTDEQLDYWIDIDKYRVILIRLHASYVNGIL